MEQAEVLKFTSHWTSKWIVKAFCGQINLYIFLQAVQLFFIEIVFRSYYAVEFFWVGRA